MTLNLQTRTGYEVDVVQLDDANLRMTVLVTNPDGKPSGRHVFNLKMLPGSDQAQICRDAYPIAFEGTTP